MSFHWWHAHQWSNWATVAVQYQEPALAEGMKGYALRQAGLRISLRNQFAKLWHDIPSWITTAFAPEDKSEVTSN